MALETASYVSDLVQTNPTSGDPQGQGDDHLRLIKSVLKTTFPTLSGPLTATPWQLNAAGGLFSTTTNDTKVRLRPQTLVSANRGGGLVFEAGASAPYYFESYTDAGYWSLFCLPVGGGPSNGAMTFGPGGNLSTSGNITSSAGNLYGHVDVNAQTGKVKEGGNALIPTGVIVMWTGAIAPAGWKLCDGTSGTPDLRSRFIVGASGTYALASTGGSASWSGNTGNGGGHTPTGTVGAGGDHNHGGSTGSYTLTISDIPSHTHGVTDPGHSHTLTQPTGPGGLTSQVPTGSSPVVLTNIPVTTNTTGITINAQGGGGSHAHTIASSGTHTHSVTLDAVSDHYHSITGVATLPPYYALAFIMKS